MQLILRDRLSDFAGTVRNESQPDSSHQSPCPTRIINCELAALSLNFTPSINSAPRGSVWVAHNEAAVRVSMDWPGSPQSVVHFIAITVGGIREPTIHSYSGYNLLALSVFPINLRHVLTPRLSSIQLSSSEPGWTYSTPSPSLPFFIDPHYTRTYSWHFLRGSLSQCSLLVCL